MRALVQRAVSGAVTLRDTGVRRAIQAGLVVLLGVAQGDTAADADYLADRVVGLRIFPDDAGKMNVALGGVPGAEALIVSQFTLCADTSKGRRPSFTGAAAPDEAEALYNRFVGAVRDTGIGVKTGEFGADMLVEIANDGPVTFLVETPGERRA
jgi:D-tyrosyl-tRNA(Tyr) deacylase